MKPERLIDAEAVLSELAKLQIARFDAAEHTDNQKLKEYYAALGTGIGIAIQQIRIMKDERP